MAQREKAYDCWIRTEYFALSYINSRSVCNWLVEMREFICMTEGKFSHYSQKRLLSPWWFKTSSNALTIEDCLACVCKMACNLPIYNHFQAGYVHIKKKIVTNCVVSWVWSPMTWMIDHGGGDGLTSLLYPSLFTSVVNQHNYPSLLWLD